MSGPASSGVFISYRCESRDIAGRLHDWIAARFGDDQVYMDVDANAPGIDFREVMTQALRTCKVLLAVIGPHWLTATDEDGRRRLDDPDDWVRMEIQTALERDIRVIPVLIRGAKMPRHEELPQSLAGLARRSAFRVGHQGFRGDVGRLLAAIEPILRPTTVAPVAIGLVAAVPGAFDPTDIAPEPRMVQVVRHRKDVNAVVFGPNGRLLATASDDERARIWEVASGQKRARVRHDDSVEAVAFRPDGRLLATASYDDSARVWALIR